MGNDIMMVITDLDGTLFDDSGRISSTNTATLRWLGDRGIQRVIATGRNLFSARKALPPDVPVDYLIFSTGAGVIDWRTGELLYAAHLMEKEVELAIGTLVDAGISFMLHDLVPDNHVFLYFDADCGSSDFLRRIELYRDFALPLNIDELNFKHASQLLAIVPENHELLEEIRVKLSSLRVVRTTSPLDGVSMWIEIFPESVSKGHTAAWLCNELSVDRLCTLGTGNDYNDLDLLNFVNYSFAMENAPGQIKRLYRTCKSNNNDGFSDAVFSIINR